ncbi:hypothetical protein IFU08_00945 [Microbacterium sp. CFBP 8790]|uniref:hypothetical protein n=1 Tax=unclassified Microbacterium TaxID=2609290 RepID=UPI0017839DE1|nr:MULTISPECIES: hypothetical protein [unclassified Microbacterium]MBD8205537.1 hypothetical protein [Microbacterium sp. CFBP 8801]MBD8508128.1 hypothetical protein [Microbacterium sp. CFBP 8790]
MAKYEINKLYNGYEGTIEADIYRVEGDYYVFYADGEKVLTVATSQVTTVELVKD